MANKIDTTNMEIEMVSLLKIRPYSNNPRFNAKSIKLLEGAITRYGFLVPITVGKDYVIVTGHSRYNAARNLDLEEIPVVVLDLPDLKIREYRIADNKVGEFSELDFDMKGAALADYTKDDELMQLAFPSFAPVEPIKAMTKTSGDEDPIIIECICPDCLHEFDANSGIPFAIEDE